MKLHIIVLLFLFIALSSNSQDRSDHNSDSKTSYINVSLGSIADPFAPRLRFGYIQYVAPHWKVGLDAGYGNEQLSLTTETNIGVDYSLWEIRPELYYIFNPEAKTLKYLSAELFYIDQNHDFRNGSFTSEDNEPLRFDSADFTRQKYGMHFKFGLFLDVGKHVGFNFFGGIGFRVANKQYSNIINPQPDNNIREWRLSPYEDEGKSFGFNPSLGIKFYYKL
jgi:hypothetical protein